MAPPTIKLMKTRSLDRIHDLSLGFASARMRSLPVRTFHCTLRLAGILSLLLLASRGSAASFSFSTRQSGASTAALSRPASPGGIQTETANDFVATQSVVIAQATITGVIPSEASLSDIARVEVEIYRVFPFDSDTNRTINVPTRNNSPADLEIHKATRDSLAGRLIFSATIVNQSFTALHTVVNGIYKSPDQTTGGEGPVTGQQVEINMAFNPPIAVPAGHYFFRPEVLLNSGNFLWLLAAEPHRPPHPRPDPHGTPVPPIPDLADLQSWIRNNELGPDWLRIAPDILGSGSVLNAIFSLSGETDADNDGVGDSLDLCPDTPAGALVNAHGCSLEQLAPCSGPAPGSRWKNHGQYVSAVAHAAEDLWAERLITEDEAEEIVSSAAQSVCGSKLK
jgi:hypothetical protein